MKKVCSTIESKNSDTSDKLPTLPTNFQQYPTNFPHFWQTSDSFLQKSDYFRQFPTKIRLLPTVSYALPTVSYKNPTNFWHLHWIRICSIKHRNTFILQDCILCSIFIAFLILLALACRLLPSPPPPPPLPPSHPRVSLSPYVFWQSPSCPSFLTTHLSLTCWLFRRFTVLLCSDEPCRASCLSNTRSFCSWRRQKKQT